MDDFNWVDARNNCTAANAFENLADGVRADIEMRVRQKPSLEQKIDYRRCDDDNFLVRRYGSHQIEFRRVDEETIKISHSPQSSEARALLTVTVGMNDEGECTLKLGDKELKPWQVRRAALEKTLF